MTITKVQHLKEMTPHYEVAEKITNKVQRILAKNPNPFTYLGSGSYLIGDGTEVAIIDPGPSDRVHLDALEKAVAGRQLSKIIVTHTHMDHSAGAVPLQKRLGGTLMGFSPHQGPDHEIKMEEGGDPTFVPEVYLKDGDVIAGDGWTLEVMHTPGHTSNHCCFRLLEEKILFTGDHVMGWATTVVSPPDGDMKDYLTQLERLLGFDDQLYVPTHGPAIPHPHSYVRALIQHRMEREQQILEAITQGAQTLPAMVSKMYQDVPRYLHPAAARSVYAHLIKLVDEGRVKTNDGKAVENSIYRI